MRGLKWNIDPIHPERDRLCQEMNLRPLMAQMLLNRGLKEKAAIFSFMQPSLKGLHDPSLMHEMARAAARIAKAIKAGEEIAIFGDYDVDGVTASSTLYHALKFFGAEPELYVPHRIDEGYGLNVEAMKKLIAGGATLIVSVDCGITAVEPAKVAKQAGIDLIVTDHHEWKDELPECYAIVHPRLDKNYPNPEICGAGVAFKLAWALWKAFTGEEKASPAYRELLMDLLCFTALGTIADVVPLQGENRVIAVNGLQRLPTCPFIGIRALLASAGLKEGVDGYHVGFCLAPRLNAAGRMGHASEALRMMTTATAEEARDIAVELEKKNKSRQATERAIVVEAKAQAATFPGVSSLVLVGDDWHTGVVGIVASRVIDDYYCPTIVMAASEGEAHGSCRSIEGFNLAQGLRHCESLLTRWGGHAMAAGVALPLENVPAFRKMLDEYVKANCPASLLQKRLDIDAIATLAELELGLIEDMKLMGPFGSHNKRPLFIIEDAIIRAPKAMGKEGKHLTFTAYQGDYRMKCISWNQGELAHKIPTDMRVNLCVEPEINEWRGQRNVELLVRDIVESK